MTRPTPEIARVLAAARATVAGGAPREVQVEQTLAAAHTDGAVGPSRRVLARARRHAVDPRIRSVIGAAYEASARDGDPYANSSDGGGAHLARF